MKKGNIQTGLIILEVISALVFFVAGWEADRALDKSGIVDPERFTYWNSISGDGIKVFLLSWIASIAVEAAQCIRQTGFAVKGILKTRLPIYITVPPVALLVLWVITIL